MSRRIIRPFAPAVMLVGVLAGCSHSFSQRPDPLPPELRLGPPFEVQVQRVFRDHVELEMIRLAERTYPPRDSLIAAIKTAHFKLDSVPSDTLLWWYSDFDNVHIPYAVTAEGVSYYLELTLAFRAGRRLQVSERYAMQRSKFTYTASADYQPDFEHNDDHWSDVYVVELQLSWSNHCGRLCALMFTKHRIVVLSTDGRVLAVLGDGKASLAVS